MYIVLIDFIRTLVKPGQKTAQAYFGTKRMDSIDLSQYLWIHHLSLKVKRWPGTSIQWQAPGWQRMSGSIMITPATKKFLKETGYDLIKSSAQFATDFLWRKPDGTYTAAPSTSPEHGPIDEGTTFVHAVIREILQDAIEAKQSTRSGQQGT